MAKRNARQEGSFVGVELTKDYKGVKHPATTSHYRKAQTPNRYYQDQPMNMMSMDIKVDDKGRVRLFGFMYFNERKQREEYKWIYVHPTQSSRNEAMEVLAQYLNDQYDNRYQVAFYDKLNAARMLRFFLEYNQANKEEWVEACRRWSQVSGEFKSIDKIGRWTSPPLASARVQQYHTNKLPKREVEIGISQSVKDTFQMYFLPFSEEGNYISSKFGSPFSIMFWDMEELFGAKNIKEACETHLDFKYDADHELDELTDEQWEDFENNGEMRKKVIRTMAYNMKTARELALTFQEYFAETFPIKNEDGELVKVYPKSLYSAGSMTNFVLATLFQDDPTAFQSIGMVSNLEEWESNGVDLKTINNIKVLSSEAYSGGLMECLRVGYTKKIWTADIASAYPFVISNLLDLRNATLHELKTELQETGEVDQHDIPIKRHRVVEELPPMDGTNYQFIRAIVEVPSHAVHTLMVKPPNFIAKRLSDGSYSQAPTNIRGGGTYKVSGIREEFEQLLEEGGEIVWMESCIVIQTEGKPHPLAKAIQRLWEMRQEFKAQGKDDTAIKTALNSLYGKLYEGFMTYTELTDGINPTGFNMGIFYNPILATVTTAHARLLLASAEKVVKENKGKVALLMQDALYWEGKGDELPERYETILGRCGWKGMATHGWTEKKTLGMFEKPQQYDDFLCLGIGRYEYTKEDGSVFVKARGLDLDINGKGTTWSGLINAKLEAEKTDIKEALTTKLTLPLHLRVVPQLVKVRMMLDGFREDDVEVDNDIWKKLGMTERKTELLNPISVAPKRKMPTASLTLLTKRMVSTLVRHSSEFLGMNDTYLDGTIASLRRKTKPSNILPIAIDPEELKKRNREHNKIRNNHIAGYCILLGIGPKKGRVVGVQFLKEAVKLDLTPQDIDDFIEVKKNYLEEHGVKQFPKAEIEKHLTLLRKMKGL